MPTVGWDADSPMPAKISRNPRPESLWEQEYDSRHHARYPIHSFKKRQIYRLRNHPVACLIGVKMIAGISCRHEAQRILRITQRHVEINDGIRSAATPNPFVDRPARCFMIRCVVKRAAEGKQRCSIDPDTLGVGTSIMCSYAAIRSPAIAAAASAPSA